MHSKLCQEYHTNIYLQDKNHLVILHVTTELNRLECLLKSQ